MTISTPLLLMLASAITAASPVVPTREGPVRGAIEEEIEVFRGIPYAAPPVGPNRWRAPQPAVRRAMPLDATRPAVACPQAGAGPILGLPRAAPSEDCLHVSIWRPRNAARAPVVVWIHGGSLVSGVGDFPLTDGTAFARRGIVFVGINYRLGFLGFFAHPALGGGARTLANFGFADQQAALRWVRANIARFGGDPAKVTLMGESAGGRSVLAHLAAPGSRGLFRQAIVESAFHMAALPSLSAARDTGQEAARRMLGEREPASAASLRALPVERIVAAQPEHLLDAPGFGLVRDGVTLSSAPFEAIVRGSAAQVPLLIGFNSNEATLMPSLGLDPAQLAASMTARHPQLMARLNPEPVAAGNAAFQLGWFEAPSRMIAAAQAKVAPTWLYRFSYRYERLAATRAGVGHGEELPLVFASLDRIPPLRAIATPRDRAMADVAITCWRNFITSGDPAGGACPQWPRYAPADDTLMDFDVAPNVRPTPGAAVLDGFVREGALGQR